MPDETTQTATTTTPPAEAGAAPDAQVPTTPPPAEAGGTAQTDAAPQIDAEAKAVATEAEAAAETTLTEVVAALRDGLHTLNRLVTDGPALLNFGQVQRDYHAALAKIDSWLGQQGG